MVPSPKPLALSVLLLAVTIAAAAAEDTVRPADAEAVLRANRERAYLRESQIESVRDLRDHYERLRIQRRHKEEQCRQDPASPVCKELETCFGPGCGSAGR